MGTSWVVRGVTLVAGDVEQGSSTMAKLQLSYYSHRSKIVKPVIPKPLLVSIFLSRRRRAGGTPHVYPRGNFHVVAHRGLV